ncbi:predicted protein, partial [Nematostella vectensis]
MQSLLVLIMLCLLGCCGAIRIEGAACNCSCDPKDGPIPPALELDPCTLSCQTLAPGGKCTTKPSFTVVNGACVSVPFCSQHCQTLEPGGSCSVEAGYVIDNNGMCYDVRFCVDKCHDFADPKDCSKYYHCDGYDDGRLRSCPTGQLWNHVNKKCDRADLVICDRDATPGTFMLPDNKIYNSLDNKKFNSPDNKSFNSLNFHINTDHHSYHASSMQPALPVAQPRRDMHGGAGYHVVSGMCQDYTFCRGKPSGYYADPKDCAQFYFCYGSAEILLSRCPRGLLWSEVKKTCDYPHLVDCSRPTTQPDTFCRGKPSGYYADPKDCAQFYFCYGSAEILLSRCPRGLLWSEVKKTCDYPHLVDCSRPTTPPGRKRNPCLEIYQNM